MENYKHIKYQPKSILEKIKYKARGSWSPVKEWTHDRRQQEEAKIKGSHRMENKLTGRNYP